MILRLTALFFSLMTALCLAQTPEILAPALVYGTYLETGSGQSPFVAADAAGSIYAAVADEKSECHSTPSGGLDCRPRYEVTVTRIDPGASEPVYAVNLGEGTVSAIAVSADGYVFVTGRLDGEYGVFFSTDFVAEIAPDGSVVYLRQMYAVLSDVAVDPYRNAYITGLSGFGGIDTTRGVHKPSLGPPGCSLGDRLGNIMIHCSDAFVLKLDPEGNTLLGTYFGGTGEDWGRGIGLDSAGNIYVTGQTRSDDFPRTYGAGQPDFGGLVTAHRDFLGDRTWGDGFAVRFEPTLRRLDYATYLGGSGLDEIAGIAVDASGNAVIVGRTQSPDLPVTKGVIQPHYRGDTVAQTDADSDGFVVKLSPSGAFTYVTYFGDFERDGLSSVALDGAGNAIISGTGRVVAPGVRPPTPCDPPGYLTKLSADGSAILGTTYLRGWTLGTSLDISAADGQMVAVATTLGNSFYHDTFATTADAVQTRGRTYVALLDFATPAPSSLACVINGASLERGHWNSVEAVIAPYEVVSFFGNDLGGAELLIDGRAAPILYAGESQINAVAPGRLEPGRVPIELMRDGERLATYEAEVVEAVPALFSSDASGRGNAAARNEDGSRNSPEHPAKRGSIVELYATGFGRLSPMPPDGSTTPLEPPWPELTQRFSAWIQAPVATGAVGMEVLYAGPAPGQVTGVIQINVRIPENAAIGDEVLIQLVLDNEERTQRDITLAVAP